MKRTILITGSAGFVGSHLVEHVLAHTDWNIVGLDSFKHRGDVERLQRSERYRIVCHDLNAPVSYRTRKEIGPVDFFVNMASNSHVDRSIDEPVPFVQNNINLVLHALEFARELKPSVFIQISTDEVYGAAHGDFKHPEWYKIIPSNPYAASKAAQEAIAISYWRTYGLPVVITNTMNILGERQDPEKYLPMLINTIFSGGVVTIHGSEKRVGSRFYLHARNMADALLFIIQKRTPQLYVDTDVELLPDRYNIVGDVEIDNLALAHMIAGFMGKRLNYKFVDFHAARPGHDRRYALDGTKLHDLGWRAPVAFSESVKKIVEWTLANPKWLE